MSTSPQHGQPREREVVFCHECDNEWYRDEQGLVCPECQSEFTEVVETGYDPREEMDLDEYDEDTAPDPDEDDIDNFTWTPNGPGQPPGMTGNRTMSRRITVDSEQFRRHQEAGGQGGLMGFIGSLVQNAVGGLQNELQQQVQQQVQQRRQQENNQRANSHENDQEEHPRAPAPPPPQANAGGGARVFHQTGPGYSVTFTSSSSMSGNLGDLFPRNAEQAQPFEHQPHNLEHMLHNIVMNIGARPGNAQAERNVNNFGPLGGLFQMFGLPNDGVMGDAVYSQEALDRIVTQLMEQHRSGNAPGPATEAAIAALPKRNIGKEDLDERGKADCSICMDVAEIGSEVTVLPCSHWFHFDCIKAWLVEHDTCPHCRQGIMPRGNESAERPRQPSEAPLNDIHSPTQQRSPTMPGGFPDGSRSNPFTVPDSPTMSRPSSSRNTTGGNPGMFSRMRDVFGGGNNTENNDSYNTRSRSREG